MKKKSPKNLLPFIELYNQFIQDSISGKRLHPNGKKVSKGTITSYECTSEGQHMSCFNFSIYLSDTT